MKRQKVTKEKQLEYQTRYHAKHPSLKAKWNKDWIKNNRERYNALKYKYRDKLKQEIIEYYSKGTNCCNDLRALCLDHVNDDGAEWRKKYKVSGRSSSGSNTYQAIKKLGNPEGLQVLCANCNLIKEIERKELNRIKNKWYKKNE